jgi:hypothetical protein
MVACTSSSCLKEVWPWQFTQEILDFGDEEGHRDCRRYLIRHSALKFYVHLPKANCNKPPVTLEVNALWLNHVASW